LLFIKNNLLLLTYEKSQTPFMSAAGTLLKPFIRNNKVLMISSIATGLLNNVITLLLTLTIGKFFDDAFSYSTNKGRILSLLGLHLDKNLFHFFLFFAALITAKLLFGWADVFLTALSGEKFSKQLRENLFETQLHQDYKVFQQKETGKYLLRYSGDMRSMQNMLTKGIIGHIKDVLFVMTGIFFLLQLQPVLAALFAGFALLLIALTMLFDGKLKKLTEAKRDVQSSLFSFVTTRLMSLQSVKAFNKESVELDRFTKRSERSFQLARQYHLISSFIQAGAPVILYTALASMLYMTTVLSSPVKGKALLSFVLLTILLFPALKRIIKTRTVWQSGNLSAGKLLEIFNMPSEFNGNELPETKINSITVGELDNEVREDDEQQSKTNTMFRGKIYFMNQKQGHSLIQFVTGTSKPPERTIFINGIDINLLPKKFVRKKIAVSADTLPLYGSSVYEAVAYSKKSENREAVEELLHTLRFSDGTTINIDNRIGLHGNQLSTGQKKILLHTRALLTNKKVLIFEEPFSGLNNVQAKALQLLLQQRSSNAIIIITGHEQSGPLQYNDIVVATPALN
jgi:ABC-type multidrug transport system fused ATPase/permease subunit